MSILTRIFWVVVTMCCAIESSTYADEISVGQKFSLGKKCFARLAAISPSGKIIAVASGEFNKGCEIRLFSVDSGKRLVTLKGHREPISCLTFTPDSQLLISGGDERSCRIWDMTTRQLVGTLKGAKNMGRHITIGQDGKRAATLVGPSKIAVWDLASRTKITTLKGRAEWEASRLAFSPDGKQLMAAGDDRKLRLWDIESRKSTVIVDKVQKDRTNAMAFSPVKGLAATCGDDCRVNVWDMNEHLSEKKFLGIPRPTGIACLGQVSNMPGRRQEPDEPYSLAFSPNGERLAAGYESGRIVFYDTRVPEFRAVATIKAHESGVGALSFSSDGKKLLSSSPFDTYVMMWRVRRGGQPGDDD